MELKPSGRNGRKTQTECLEEDFGTVQTLNP
jgi:hypothetical protein